MRQLGKAAERGDAEQVQPAQHLDGWIGQHLQGQRVKEMPLTASGHQHDPAGLRADLPGSLLGYELAGGYAQDRPQRGDLIGLLNETQGEGIFGWEGPRQRADVDGQFAPVAALDGVAN